ncbi:DUF4908 domain-containing protein [Phenylobacterium sp.]|uniref:DUF4908 domain-containing protein n=1 Tax=Phenylobacterium sp. TaxID=1871053 RepID=UPI0025FD8B97|nr:DUF4908 domain-containing protein [Phenylobacterium sp.]
MQTAAGRAICAALFGVAMLTFASSAGAGPADKLRDSLFKNRPGEVPGAPVGCFMSEDGRIFTLDRTQPSPLLKFEDSPEVWALLPSPAPRGDVIYKNDLGQPMLRATRLGGFTLFTDKRPSGEAVSRAGGCGPLRLMLISPQALGERMLQASVRSGRAARRPVLFEAEATPNSAALIADAALVVTLAYLRIASDGGRPMLAKVGKVQFSEGKKAQVSFSGGVLRIIVAPSQGLAGRPSSERVEKVLRTGK